MCPNSTFIANIAKEERGVPTNLLGNNLYALMPIVVISREDVPTIRSTRGRSGYEPQDLVKQLEEEKKFFFEVDRKPTHNITWFNRSNRSCVRPREKIGETLLKLWGSTIRITYTSR